MSNLHPITNRLLTRNEKEQILKQKGLVVWFYGLSGSGKSTIAIQLEQELHARGILCKVLDGDNIRTGLNNNLGFTDEDRRENIRRIAEVSKLMAQTGIVTICSFITPKEELRALTLCILEDDLLDVYVHASYETCEKRDVKGLYAKANEGKIVNFTGKDSGFEIPETPTLRIDTERQSVEESTKVVLDALLPRIQLSGVPQTAF
jgi:adenylylsulfate kinase